MSKTFPDAEFVGAATVSGSLYDLGEYPGLQLDNSGAVVGEVYEVDDELLNQLDAFEASSDYSRKQVEIALDADNKPGWTYEPDASLCANRPLITSGDWIEYAKTRKLNSRF